MTFTRFCKAPGDALDSLRVGTVIELTLKGAVIARLSGVATAVGEVWTVSNCKSRAALRRKLRDGGRVVVSRWGLVEAVIEGVKS